MLLLAFLACTSDPSTGADDSGTFDGGSDGGGSNPACWTDLAPGQVRTVTSGFSDGTEGLAFVDGRLFVTAPTQVVEIHPDGSTAVLWTNDHALGLARVGDELWVADPGTFSMAGDSDGQVWALGLDGSARLVSDGASNPNFLAATPWGTVLLADDTVDGLWEIDPATGARSLWLADVPSPNGIGVTAQAVTVASTFVADAPVWRASVQDGVAGSAEVLANTVTGGANDGLVLGADGSTWVAVNLAGELWRIGPDGAAASFVQDLDSPASLGFGEGSDWDPCSIYATSLFGEEVVRIAVGTD